MAALSLYENGIFNNLPSGSGVGGEDVRKVSSELLRARQSRRSSQPMAVHGSRRDSVTREPVQTYRRGSAVQEPIQSYRRDSMTKEPFQQSYRRGSLAQELIENIRRDSISRDPLQTYRRDSITKDYAQTYYGRDAPTPEIPGRRGSDADDISWIAKYQKSDHHTDRLVNTKLEQDRAVGRNFSPHLDERKTQGNRAAFTFSPIAASIHDSKPPLNPHRYEGTNKLTVFLQPSSPSVFLPVISTRSIVDSHNNLSPLSARYMTETNQSPSSKPLFQRAPSLPPYMPNTLSPLLSSSDAFGSSSVHNTVHNLASRRSSLASINDTRTPRYRRSVDYVSPKNSLNDLRSPYLSNRGSDINRRMSYSSLPLSSLSPLSPSSPHSSFSSSSFSSTSLPPPSERIFGSKSTQSSIRNRRQIVDG